MLDFSENRLYDYESAARLERKSFFVAGKAKAKKIGSGRRKSCHKKILNCFRCNQIAAQKKLFLQIFIKISGLENSTDYEIFSIDGKLIKKGKANPNSEINISTLVKGTYILKFNNQSVKIIKE